MWCVLHIGSFPPLGRPRLHCIAVVTAAQQAFQPTKARHATARDAAK
jgi:hypothetical protein